ncbi:MAG TPA: cupin domain-containing protein [Terriglobales bacterium]|nr:cupin domain-containing protein [Terriglobales bacterium]
MLKPLATATLLLFAISLFAQDATVAEPKHYRVAFENEHVRVIDIHYGPHEKSNMHSHPAGVIVYITEGHFRFTDEHGKIIEANAKPGDARWFPAFKHKVESLSDKPFDGVYVELKNAGTQ